MKILHPCISLFVCVSAFVQGQSPLSVLKTASHYTKHEIAGWERKAENVTIIRDTWGVPHVYGKTNADAVFGLTYARAEDEFSKIEDACIQAIGRSAEISGNPGLENDVLIHAFETVDVARQELKTSSRIVQQMAISWADALNYYLYKHPEVKTKLLQRFEPWFLFAETRKRFYMGNIARELQNKKVRVVQQQEPDGTGSNMWALNGFRIKGAKSFLFINPHTALDIGWEGHAVSEEGLNVSGVLGYGGGMLPIIGHNEYIGWSMTNNLPDVVDLYEEIFSSTDTLRYQYGNSYRTASTWVTPIAVKTGNNIQIRKHAFIKTHHGPIFHLNGKRIAVAVPKFSQANVIEQTYELSIAKSLAEFKAAIAKQRLLFLNYMYADVKGNIFYIYNGIIPKRRPDFDWSGIVSGKNPKSDWIGILGMKDLPQVENPKAAFVQNCNSLPYFTTSHNNPDSNSYPSYLMPDEISNSRNPYQTARASNSLQLLSAAQNWDFSTFTEKITDRFAYMASIDIPWVLQHFDEYRIKFPDKAADIEPLLIELQNWNMHNDAHSTAAGIFSLMNFYGRYPDSIRRDSFFRFTALHKTKSYLQEKFESWKVPLGDIQRHQRPPNSDTSESLPVAGGAGSVGTIFCYNTAVIPGQKRKYGRHGNSYVAAISFGDKIHSVSILPFGNSSDPSSAHYFDQAPLYVEGKFKEAWFYKQDVLKNAKRTYHPGK